ncbi:MAG: hypothetical protein NTV58_06335 [Deltaproteobacteria bacterium]|nr:hypothetical protein [Deltaproteobacteria bacterium]
MEPFEVEQKNEKPGKRPKTREKVDQKMLDLKARGLTYEEIGNLCGGLSRQAVHRRIGGHLTDEEKLLHYKNNRADLLAMTQERILASIDDETISKANLQTKAMAYGVLFDKERLERNLSTSNLSEHIRVKTMNAEEKATLDMALEVIYGNKANPPRLPLNQTATTNDDEEKDE